MFDGAIIMLHHEPELLLRLIEHRGQVHLVAVVDPVAILFAYDFGERGLI